MKDPLVAILMYDHNAGKQLKALREFCYKGTFVSHFQKKIKIRT